MPGDLHRCLSYDVFVQLCRSAWRRAWNVLPESFRQVAPILEQFSALPSILSSSNSGAWQNEENVRRTLLARRLENCGTSGD
jgi:hypothetical protein